MKKQLLNGLRVVFASALVFMAIATAKLYKIDDKSCSQCGICIEECPEEAIKVKDVDGKKYHYIDAKLCNGCALCVEACPEGSIVEDDGEGK